MGTVCIVYGGELRIGKPERKNHLKDLGIDGRIILKSILKELG
jgi:hypothetical protein